MKDLKKIKYWLFDLDNTLYDGATKVFEQVDKKMTKFISEKLKVTPEEAKKIQKNYFQEYNTTLNGMIKHHKIDADEFLEFVHDVDLNFLNKDNLLEDQIKKLEGKKIIFTNGSRAHAINVTKRIGIDKLFDGIFDINRLGLTDTFEAGHNLTLGFDYKKEKIENINKYFEFKLGKVLRLKTNKILLVQNLA